MNIQNKIADYLKKIGKIVEKIMMVLVACAFISAIPHCYYSNRHTKEWLNEPRVGDVYFVNIARIDEIEIPSLVFKKETYSLLNIVSIDEKGITFLIHKEKAHGTRQRLSFKYKSRFDFSNETVTIPVRKLHEYHAKDVITKIERN